MKGENTKNVNKPSSSLMGFDTSQKTPHPLETPRYNPFSWMRGSVDRFVSMLNAFGAKLVSMLSVFRSRKVLITMASISVVLIGGYYVVQAAGMDSKPVATQQVSKKKGSQQQVSKVDEGPTGFGEIPIEDGNPLNQPAVNKTNEVKTPTKEDKPSKVVVKIPETVKTPKSNPIVVKNPSVKPPPTQPAPLQPTPIQPSTPAPVLNVNLVKNCGFEDGLTGWSSWSPSGQSSIHDIATDYPYRGKKNLVHWSDQDYRQRTYQRITNLQDGVYVAKVRVRSSGGQNKLTLEVTKYNNGQGSVSTNIGTHAMPDTWKTITSAKIKVVGGSVNIGVYSNAYAENWADFDHLELYRVE